MVLLEILEHRVLQDFQVLLDRVEFLAPRDPLAQPGKLELLARPVRLVIPDRQETLGRLEHRERLALLEVLEQLVQQVREVSPVPLDRLVCLEHQATQVHLGNQARQASPGLREHLEQLEPPEALV